jgi:hypothetical protein
MRKKLFGISYYFGTLPPLTGLTVRMLCRQSDEIHLFCDSEANAVFPEGLEPPSNFFVHTISIEDYRKRIADAVDRPVAFNNPYKICDHKPIWPLVSKIEHAKKGDIIFWFDIGDCIWGDIRKYMPLSESNEHTIDARPVVYGNRGHITGIDYELAINIREWLDGYFGASEWRRIMAEPRHYAFDEFNYFHKFLSHFSAVGKIVWDTGLSANAIDIDYWHLVPYDAVTGSRICQMRVDDNGARPRIIARTEAKHGGAARGSPEQAIRCPGVISDVEASYVHLQKRKIDMTAADCKVLSGSEFYINIYEDGSARLEPTSHVVARDGFPQRMRWFLMMLRKRLVAKVLIEQFS